MLCVESFSRAVGGFLILLVDLYLLTLQMVIQLLALELPPHLDGAQCHYHPTAEALLHVIFLIPLWNTADIPESTSAAKTFVRAKSRATHCMVHLTLVSCSIFTVLETYLLLFDWSNGFSTHWMSC